MTYSQSYNTFMPCPFKFTSGARCPKPSTLNPKVNLGKALLERQGEGCYESHAPLHRLLEIVEVKRHHVPASKPTFPVKCRNARFVVKCRDAQVWVTGERPPHGECGEHCAGCRFVLRKPIGSGGETRDQPREEGKATGRKEGEGTL